MITYWTVYCCRGNDILVWWYFSGYFSRWTSVSWLPMPADFPSLFLLNQWMLLVQNWPEIFISSLTPSLWMACMWLSNNIFIIMQLLTQLANASALILFNMSQTSWSWLALIITAFSSFFLFFTVKPCSHLIILNFVSYLTGSSI